MRIVVLHLPFVFYGIRQKGYFRSAGVLFKLFEIFQGLHGLLEQFRIGNILFPCYGKGEILSHDFFRIGGVRSVLSHQRMEVFSLIDGVNDGLSVFLLGD